MGSWSHGLHHPGRRTRPLTGVCTHIAVGISKPVLPDEMANLLPLTR